MSDVLFSPAMAASLLHPADRKGKDRAARERPQIAQILQSGARRRAEIYKLLIGAQIDR
jgi:hypothetical protein